MKLQEKIYKSTIYTGHKFLTMHKKILIVGSSGSGKSNVLLNLINHQPDIDKIVLYIKDLYKPKY